MPGSITGSPSPIKGSFEIICCAGCDAWHADIPGERTRHSNCLGDRVAREKEEAAQEKKDEGQDNGDKDGKADVAPAK